MDLKVKGEVQPFFYPLDLFAASSSFSRKK